MTNPYQPPLNRVLTAGYPVPFVFLNAILLVVFTALYWFVATSSPSAGMSLEQEGSSLRVSQSAALMSAEWIVVAAAVATIILGNVVLYVGRQVAGKSDG